MLRLVEPYIAWEYPYLKKICYLVYKRGFGKVEHRRTPLTHKSIIEDAFAKFGIICIEDVIHEIVTVDAQNVY